MKISTIVILLILAISYNLQSANDYFKADTIITTGLDSEVLLLGSMTNSTKYDLCIVNLETNETEFVDLHSSFFKSNIIVNALTKRIASYGGNKLYVNNYKTGKNVNSFELSTFRTKFSFSKDGQSIHAFDYENGIFYSYDISTGEKVLRFTIEEFPINPEKIFFNTDKNELAFNIDSSLVYWSIDEGKIDRTTPFIPYPLHVSFRDKGNKVAYSLGTTVYIDNTIDGTNTFKKKFIDVELYPHYCFDCKLDFSENMQYLVFTPNREISFIYDLIADSSVGYPYIINEFDNLNITHYVSSDKSKMLYSTDVYKYCNRYAEMPYEIYAPYIYDVEEHISTSIPKGFVKFWKKYVIGNDNENIIVSNGNTTVMINKDEEFIRYLDFEFEPVLLFYYSRYVALMDSAVMKIYNLQTEKYEREFDTGNNNNYGFHFTKIDDGKILIVDSATIKVYRFSDFILENEFKYKDYNIGSSQIKFDGNQHITAFSKGKVYRFNILSSELYISDEIETPADYKYEDMTNDGYFLLYHHKDKKQIMKYNIDKSEYTEVRLHPDKIRDYSTFRGIGFLGNHELVWYVYDWDMIYKQYASRIYDFREDTETAYVGEYDPIISDDGKLYIGSECPDSYVIREIRNPRTSVEIANEITGTVYPNPASDFIQLDYDMSTGFSDIQIYNSFGMQVMTIEVAKISDRIDISSLTAGMYFVKVGSKSWKFIKL